jgi:hypothetical protein
MACRAGTAASVSRVPCQMMKMISYRSERAAPARAGTSGPLSLRASFPALACLRTDYFLYQGSPSFISIISVKGLAQAIGQKVTLQIL